MSAANSGSVGRGGSVVLSPDQVDGLVNFLFIECLKSAGQAIGKAQWEISRRLPVREDEATLAFLQTAAEEIAKVLRAF